MASKTIIVSDYSSAEIADEKQLATITVKFGDRRKGQIVSEAHVNDPIVVDIATAGRQQAKRGRRANSSR
jgi:hypothetical protein